MTLYGVFTVHFSPNVPSRCLLLELLDVSVSELLLCSSHQGCSLWAIQHCARDVLEALAFLHREGYVHADLKPRNILWSAESECFKLIDFGLSFKEGNQVRDGSQVRRGLRRAEAVPRGFRSVCDCDSGSRARVWSGRGPVTCEGARNCRQVFSQCPCSSAVPWRHETEEARGRPESVRPRP